MIGTATRAVTLGGLASIVAIFIDVGAAYADKRVALIVGNSAYQSVSQLPNPANDAAAIAKMFTQAGFDVVNAKTNLGNLEFKRTLREFTFSAKDADIAAIYFAGHGIEVRGINYLIPVDAKLASDYDAEDEAVSLNRIIEGLETVKRLRLIILDACRDNPFNRTMQRMVASRAVASGLARVEPPTTDTLIAFAARAGSTAEDGSGTNSPFTAALIKHLPVPGRDIRIAFGHVRDDVMAATNRKQEPFVYGSLGGAALSLVPAIEVARDQTADIRRDYELAAQVGTKEAWASFLNTYKDGFFADLARGQIGKINAARKADEDAAAARVKADTAQRAKDEIDKAKAAAADQARAAEAVEKARLDAAEKARAAEAAEKARIEATQKAEAAKTQVAALTPPAATPPPPDSAQISRSLQTELKRVGCNTGSVDSEWTGSARRALENFNRYAGRKFDVKVASLDALDAVKAKKARVCPLECERGYRTQGETCVAIACKPGLVLGDDGDCVRPKEKPKTATTPAKRDEPAASSAAKPAESNRVACNYGGCTRVPANCRVEKYNCGRGYDYCDRVVCP